MYPCKLCEIRTAEPEGICLFCRCRNRFWHSLDRVPVRARPWALTNLRVWTGVIEEECEKIGEADAARQRKALQLRRALHPPKARALLERGGWTRKTRSPTRGGLAPRKRKSVQGRGILLEESWTLRRRRKGRLRVDQKSTKRLSRPRSRRRRDRSRSQKEQIQERSSRRQERRGWRKGAQGKAIGEAAKDSFEITTKRQGRTTS